MKSGKGHQEEEEDVYEDFAPPPTNNTKDGKNSDKANAVRSKHSVTEQRRRSKINERFQILRELIPNSDQKRDTASFLLEVIQYVQFLQEKVQKYERPFQPWNAEPTKLMPWASMPVSSTNDGGISQTLNMTASDAQLPEYSMAADATNHQDELTVEGGTISISSIYSQGLLNSLTRALQSTGLDLSQANISVQINLGKQSNRGSPLKLSTTKDNDASGNQPKGSFHDATYSEDFDQAQKRMKI